MWRRTLLAAEPAEFFLQLLGLPLGCVRAGYGLAGRRVELLRLAALPAEVEAQDLALFLQDAVLRFPGGDGFVSVFHQRVAGQLGLVVLADFVETPVFRCP